MSDEELAAWAAMIEIPSPGELDGSEPIDDPPAGFATWDEWCRHRWPPSVSWRLLLLASAIWRCWLPLGGGHYACQDRSSACPKDHAHNAAER